MTTLAAAQMLLFFFLLIVIVWRVALRYEQAIYCHGPKSAGRFILTMHMMVWRVRRTAKKLGLGHLDIDVRNQPNIKTIDFDGLPGVEVYYSVEDNTIYIDSRLASNDIMGFYRLMAKGVVQFLQYASHYGYGADANIDIKYGDIEADLVANAFMRRRNPFSAGHFDYQLEMAKATGEENYKMFIHNLSMGSSIPVELNPLFGPIAERMAADRLEAIHARIYSGTNYVDFYIDDQKKVV